jgi:DNA-directed RNA polymerase subunit RPC12/RpoP
MGIVKSEDVIGWDEDGKIICSDCGESGEGKPLTEDDFKEDDVVTCDHCGRRIL